MSEPLPYSPPKPSPPRSELTSIGVWFFSAVAAIALLLAAVVMFRSGAAPWPGLVAGIALIAAAELWFAAKYPITTKALDAAGIGILFATLYSIHAQGIVPLAVAFVAMLIVTAVAVYLATRRDSIFIAVLGLLGGFATAYMLSSSGDYPLPLFAYLLALNIGIAWLALRKGWWLLSALSVVLTAIYEWGWALQAMTFGRLVLMAILFVLFAVVGTAPLWHRRAADCPPRYRWIAAAAAHLPLLFAIYVASQTNYGSQYYVLFAFLLIVDAGLLAIVRRGGPEWLHAAGGVATLITFLIWLRVSYTPAAWPWLLLWLALFIVLYLVEVTPFAGLLFAVFIGIAIREPTHWAAIVATMLVMLAVVVVVTLKRGRPLVGAMAIALSCIALMMLHPSLWTLIALHALLFIALFAVAWISERPVLAILAIPFYVGMLITASSQPGWEPYSPWTLLAIAVVPWLLFVPYPLALGARAKASLAPYTAAALASVVLFICAWITRGAIDADHVFVRVWMTGDAIAVDHRWLFHRWLIGLVPLAEAIAAFVLLRLALKLEPREPRVTLMATLTLAFLTAAIPMLLPPGWVVVVAAAVVAALVWLYVRFRHPVPLVWSVGLAVVVFFWLAFDANLFGLSWWYFGVSWPVYVAIYVVCGAAMFVAAFLIRFVNPLLQRIFSVACLFELWFLINILIANCYHSSNGAVVFDFVTWQPAESVLYTIAWAVIATGLLILGYLIRWPAARGAALALLLAAVLKTFLSDLPRLHDHDLTYSLVGLGLSVAVVGIVLQRRWVGKSIGLDLPV